MVVEDDEQYAKVFTAGVYQGGGISPPKSQTEGAILFSLKLFFFYLNHLCKHFILCTLCFLLVYLRIFLMFFISCFS